MRLCFIISSLLLISIVRSQHDIQSSPFFANPESNVGGSLLNKFRIADYQANNNIVSNDVDAGEIIGPLMSPFMDMFDVMQQNAKARAYAEKVRQDREDSPLSHSRSIFDIFEKLQRPTTTTTPQPPLIERLLKPYIEPWERELDNFSKNMAGIINPIPSTTQPTTTTTTQMNILEKSLGIFFPSLRRKHNRESVITTTTSAPPTLFDRDVLERILFTRNKRAIRYRRQATLPRAEVNPSVVPPTPLGLIKPLPLFPTWEKPILDIANPFTPNPYMAIFTTASPIPSLPEPIKIKDQFVHDPATLPLMQPQFKIQDPFYNPLFPNRKSKLFDMLAGGEAVRLLGK